MARETPKDVREAGNPENKAETAQGQITEKGQKTHQESAYQVNELAANACKIFGTRKECVMAALKAAGKTECTVSEAKKIVSGFLRKEVR